MSKEKLLYILNEIRRFLTNKRFILNLFGIILFIGIVLFGVFSWLRYYTHHGQKKSLPDYVSQNLDISIEDAQARSFQIIVNDSVHIVGKPGGIIQNQNPIGGSLVKENRKIYVTITKSKADKIDLSDMSFYGENFDQIEAQLKRKSIKSNVKSTRFDGLSQNSVIEVWHDGQMVINRKKSAKGLIVDKGATLEFIISSSEGGVEDVPQITNRSVETAQWMLKNRGLKLRITNQSDLKDGSDDSAIIAEQEPAAGSSLPRGSTISVTIKE